MSNKTHPTDSQTRVGKTNWAALEAMSDEEAEAAALADPDAPPHVGERPLRRMSRAKQVRFALRLTRQEFADRYGIPADTLKSWERHEVAIDAVALAYLDAIAADPEGVAKALAQTRSRPRAAE